MKIGIKYDIIYLQNLKEIGGFMIDFVFNARDVHWVYNEETGAIPFILNENKNKVKQLEDSLVIEISEKNKCSNPLTSAKKTFEDYYNKDMDYVNYTAVFAQVNMFQNLQWFYLQKLDGNTCLNADQVQFLTENYNKKIVKARRREAVERAKKIAEKEARQRVFDF